METALNKIHCIEVSVIINFRHLHCPGSAETDSIICVSKKVAFEFVSRIRGARKGRKSEIGRVDALWRPF